MVTTDANLAMQGYELTPAERRRMRIALRFSTGTCLVLVAAATTARSATALAAIALVGVSAGWSAHHPFDRLWNAVARGVGGAPLIPRTPRRRRHGFKVAAVWIGTTAALLASGLTAVALTLAGVLIALCAVQTFTYLCVPSLAIAAWEERIRPLLHPTPPTTGGHR